MKAGMPKCRQAGRLRGARREVGRLGNKNGGRMDMARTTGRKKAGRPEQI
jgi:hypothetical protein